MCPEELFEINIVLQNKTFFFFKHWAKHVRKKPIFLLRSINCKLRDQRSFFGKFPWGSSGYFIYFGLLAKTIRSVRRNCLLWALRIVLKDKGFFSKKFSLFSGFGSNISCTFGKTILVGWPIWRWKSPGDYFENNVFFEKKFFFLRPWAKHGQKRQMFLLRSINCKLCDQRNFFGNFSWVSSSYFIYFGLLAQTIRSVCQNCFLWALRIVLREKGFFSKTFFQVFRNWIKHFLYFWQNNFGRVAELRLEEPRGTFWEQCFFLKKNILFQTLREKRSEKRKIFRPRSPNCIIRDHKIILRNFFLRFRDLFCHFRTFSKNNSERLSKLLSMSPRDRFGKKLFFRHPDFFPKLLDLQPTILGFCVKKSRVVCQNFILRFQISVILKKNIFWKNR